MSSSLGTGIEDRFYRYGSKKAINLKENKRWQITKLLYIRLSIRTELSLRSSRSEDVRVMLDKDIAEYFDVTTGNLNKAMKRNIKRFPKNFCFQISREEYKEILRFQSGSLELEQGQYSKYPIPLSRHLLRHPLARYSSHLLKIQAKKPLPH